jgi:hypothetical protein
MNELIHPDRSNGVDWRAARITLLLLLLTSLLLLAPALRPGTMLLPAHLPYLLDPLWQLLAPPGAIAGANPILGDQFYQYHAWKSATRQALANGELPLWSAAVNGGQPLLANGQVGLFDPFNLVGMLFPLTTSYVVGALLRLWVAGIFTYVYARTTGLSLLASWLAMLVFAFSGPLVSWLGATPSHVMVWLPALLWAGEKMISRRRLGWSLVAASLLGLMVLSAQPEIAFQIGMVWGIYLICRAAWLEGGILPALRRHAAWWVLVALLGVALAAVEALPFVDALRYSVVFDQRLATTTPDLAQWLRRIFLDWQAWPTLVTALLPNFLGREADDSYWYPAGNSIENNAYAGVLPLLLALLALWAGWRGQKERARGWFWLWGGLGAGALALAVGLPLLNALNYLPPFNLVAPGRLRVVYVFAVAILAGWGLDFLRADTKLRRPLFILLVLAALANLVLVGAAYGGFTLYAEQLIASGRAFMEANVGTPSLDQPLAELYALVDARHEAKLAMLRPSNPVMYLPLLVAIVVALLLWLERKGRLSRSLFVAALISIAWLDLFWTGAGLNASAPAAWLEPVPPAVEYLQQQPGLFRVVGTQLILNPNMAILTGLEDVRGYDPLAVKRYNDLLSGLDGYAPAHYHNYFRHVDDPRLDLLNATYALSRTPPTDPRWEPVFDDPSGVTVYRSRTVLPRAHIVYDAEVVENAQASLAHTLDPTFDSRQNVVLEQMPLGWTPPTSPPAIPPQVAFVEHEANRVRLNVVTDASGLLVLTDTYLPGWRASVDGQSAPIYIANHAFRAVVVPAGTHAVTFTYAPASLPWGAGISGAALIVLLAGALWARRLLPREFQREGLSP